MRARKRFGELGQTALKVSQAPAPSSVTSRAHHDSGLGNKEDPRSSIPPNLPFALASISLGMAEVGKPDVAPWPRGGDRVAGECPKQLESPHSLSHLRTQVASACR